MKRLLPLILVFIIVLLLLAVGYLLAGKAGMKMPLVTENSKLSAHTVLKGVLPIGEYASLAYHYTSVVKDINSKDIKGWNIPFTTRKYIFTYDGVMKLGIDAGKISIGETGVEPDGAETEDMPVIRITLPPVKILSHEIIDDSIEVFEQSQTIFNEIKIEDAFKVTAERKLEMEAKAMEGNAVEEARVSLEQQFGALLGGLPGIKDSYRVEFVWAAPGAQ
jgi:hypothetical protein